MFTGNDVFYSIVGLAIFIITASILTGYLGSYAKTNIGLPVVEGFNGNENNLDEVNEKLSDGVSNLDDNLRIDKYKDDYKKMSSLTKDYFEGLKLAILMDLKDINVKKDSSSKVRQKVMHVGLMLSAIHKGIESIENIDVGGGNSGGDSGDSGGGEGGGWL
jgi:hypothetical protein